MREHQPMLGTPSSIFSVCSLWHCRNMLRQWRQANEKKKILLNFKRYIGTLKHICIHLIWYKQFRGKKNYSQTYFLSYNDNLHIIHIYIYVWKRLINTLLCGANIHVLQFFFLVPIILFYFLPAYKVFVCPFFLVAVMTSVYVYSIHIEVKPCTTG